MRRLAARTRACCHQGRIERQRLPAATTAQRLVRRALSGIGLVALGLLTLLLATTPAAADPGPLRIGSKRFTESYILAEVMAQTVRQAAPGAAVEIRQGLGNTAIVLAALKAGSIDVYPEYTGTIEREILGHPGTGASLEDLRAALKPMGLGVDVPLGFNNGYALAMAGATAQRLGLTRLSQLHDHPALRAGLSNEFMGRADGWPGLARRYGLPQQPQGLDHGLAYQALRDGSIDLTDIYTTDAQIAAQHLVVLEDDAHYFPRYDAVLLYRLSAPAAHPEAWRALRSLAGRITEAAMIDMNAQAELQGRGFEAIARDFVRPGAGAGAAAASAGSDSASTSAQAPQTVAAAPPPARAQAPGLWARLTGPDLPRLAGQHLALVLGAVGLATLIGVPLAIALHPWPRWRETLLAVCALLQTVPSLALLALLIWLLGRIGPVPALVALTLYALLPILRNCTVGLDEVPEGLVLAGTALGLQRGQVLRHIQLPLAAPVMLAGVRTATSLSVGTATMAAFIGAGGFGERIVTGLALNDQTLLLAGALPAAALALALEGVFSLLGRRLVRRPAH